MFVQDYNYIQSPLLTLAYPHFPSFNSLTSSTTCLSFFAQSSIPVLVPIAFFPALLNSISYRDLLDLSCVGDDLLHDLHGLALGLSRLSLTLGCRSLDNLYLLALTHLHGHRRTLTERKRKIEAERETDGRRQRQ